MGKSLWTKNSKGIFTTKSAWELFRIKEEEKEDLKVIWIKCVPFKYSFLTWRVWKSFIPIAIVIH